MRERRAFTLTEVMVAVGIVLLLVAILFPVASTIKSRAQETACSTAAMQNGFALLMYTQDYDAIYPNHDQSNVQNNPGKGRGGAIVDEWSTTRKPNWSLEVRSYARSKDLLTCDANQGWADQTDKTQPPLTFIFNGWASERGQSEATTPSTIVMLFDCRYETSWSTADPSAVLPRFNSNGNGGGNGNGNANGRGTDGGTYFDVWNETNAPPHRVSGDKGRYNIVFLDGHAGSMDSDLFQSHANYSKHKPPRNVIPPIPQNHFAF